MKQEEQTYWQIHDFLKGRLTGQELEEFQKQLAGDSYLQNEVAKHKLANQLIINNRLQVAKQASIETQAQYKKGLLYKKIGIGTGLAVFIGVVSFLVLHHEKDTSVITFNKVPQKNASVKTVINETLIEEKTQTIKEKESKRVFSTHKGNLLKNERAEASSPVETVPQMAKETVVEKVRAADVHSFSRPEGEKPILPSLPNKAEIIKVEKSCADTKIKANISITNACQGDNNGSIIASRFQGGVAPYHYEVQSPANSHVFTPSALPLGTYVVLITDAQHCTTKIDNVIVKGVICEVEEKEFNPFLDETIELPAYTSGGTFAVHEKNGSLYYKKEIGQGEKIEWNGKSSQGQLESGYFSYEIQYHDGTRKQGAITITR